MSTALTRSIKISTTSCLNRFMVFQPHYYPLSSPFKTISVNKILIIIVTYWTLVHSPQILFRHLYRRPRDTDRPPFCPSTCNSRCTLTVTEYLRNKQQKCKKKCMSYIKMPSFFNLPTQVVSAIALKSSVLAFKMR